MPSFNRFHSKAILTVVSAIIVLAIANVFAGGKVVAIVNGVEIKEDALSTAVNKILPMASFHVRVSEEKLQDIRRKALKTLIEEELLYQHAKKSKIVIPEDSLEQQIVMMKSGYTSKKAYEKELAKTGLSRDRFQKRLQRRLLIQEILQQEVDEKVVVNDKHLYDYYLANKDKFILPKQIRVRHILISVKPGAMAAGWQAGQKQAQELYASLQAGSDFAGVARKYSADTTSNEQGGDLGWIHQGQFIPELDEAVEALEIGEMTKPVRTIYGFHILKLEDIRPEKQLPFEQVNLESLKKRLLKKRREERKKTFIASLEERASIRIIDP